MPYIAYEPELIDSKLRKGKENYPMVLDPKTTIRDLSVAFDLNIIFQSKEISANLRNDKFYIGIRNAVIEISADNGKCLRATKDVSMDVEYTVDISRSTEVKETDSGESQFSQTPVTAKLSQELSISEVEGKKTTGRFNKSEKQLASKVMSDRVQWTYALPNHDSLVSELLDEVLTLQVSFEWNYNPMKGHILLKPGKVEVFDAERKRFPHYKYMAFLQVLFHKQILIHKENIHINYEVY